MSTRKTYGLVTIQDIVDQIPENRIDAFLSILEIG